MGLLFAMMDRKLFYLGFFSFFEGGTVRLHLSLGGVLQGFFIRQSRRVGHPSYLADCDGGPVHIVRTTRNCALPLIMRA